MLPRFLALKGIKFTQNRNRPCSDMPPELFMVKCLSDDPLRRWIYSENPGLPKGIESHTHWVGCRFTQDHMIDKIDFHGAGRFAQQPGELQVCARWRRVAARVIVDTCDGNCSMLDCTSEHLAWMR